MLPDATWFTSGTAAWQFDAGGAASRCSSSQWLARACEAAGTSAALDGNKPNLVVHSQSVYNVAAHCACMLHGCF